jgi:hypothetical protein
MTNPLSVWVFPSTAKCGHLNQRTETTQHSAAIAKVNAETVKSNAKLEAAGEKPLPPDAAPAFRALRDAPHGSNTHGPVL